MFKLSRLVLCLAICFAAPIGVMAQTQIADIAKPAIESIQTAININQAGEDELKSLEHIGKKRASAIIAYRKAHGSFKDVDELANVKGISKAYVDQHRTELTV